MTNWHTTTGTTGLVSFSKNGTALQTVGPRSAAIHCLDMFREGERLVIGGEDGILRLFRVSAFHGDIKESTKLEGHKDAVKCVATSPDGNLIASGREGKTVRVWQAP